MKYFLLFMILTGVVSGETLTNPQLIFREQELSDYTLPITEIIEAIRTIIFAIVNNVNRTIELIKENLEDVIKVIKDKIANIIEINQNQLKGLLKEIEEIVTNLKKQSKHAKECVKKYEEDIKEAALSVKERVKLCGSKAYERIQDIDKAVQEQIASVSGHLKNVEDIIKDCSNSSKNPIVILRCGITKASEITTEVKGLINDINEGITIARQTLMEILQESSKCSRNAIADYRRELKEIRGKIEECIKEKKSTTDMF